LIAKSKLNRIIRTVSAFWLDPCHTRWTRKLWSPSSSIKSTIYQCGG